jgi:hypothetical protein
MISIPVFQYLGANATGIAAGIMATSSSGRSKDQPDLSQREGKLGTSILFAEYPYTAVLIKLDSMATFQDMKLHYYELMIKLALHEDNYLDACKAWQEVWDTEEVKANEQQNMQVS